jgi:hypothetical protein
VYVLATCIHVLNRPDKILGLSTVCLLVAAALALGNMLRISRVGVLRRIVGYSCIVGFAFSLNGIGPSLESANAAHYDSPAGGRPSSFHTFYTNWLKAEAPSERGPLILIAVAGGGVRAAAHGIALSLADDLSGGKFDDRTLLISSVSGGALGAATWLGQRTDGLPSADRMFIRSGGISPRALQLSRFFYKNDFLSPTLNRLLLHGHSIGSNAN